MAMRSFPSRTCRSACSARMAASRVAVWRSAIRSSISAPRWRLGLFSGAARDAAEAAAGPALNPLLALPASARRALRQRLSEILAADSDARGNARACCTTPAPARCTCRRRRRLHRFLRRHPSRAQGRPDLAPRQSADAELQIRAGRLSQPRLVGAAVGRGRAAAERPAQAAERDGADVRAMPQSRLRTGTRRVDRTRQPAGRADSDRRGGRTHRRLLPAERLVGARHPVVGIAAARAVPGQELPHLGLAVDHHAGGAGAVPHRAARATRRRSAAAAASSRRGGSGAWRLRHRLRGVPVHAGDACRRRRAASDVPLQYARAVLDGGADGRAPRVERLQSAARATCSAAARSPAPTRPASAACWR